VACRLSLGGTGRPNEVTIPVEQADRARGEPLERDFLQTGRPMTAIDRLWHNGSGHGCAAGGERKENEKEKRKTGAREEDSFQFAEVYPQANRKQETQNRQLRLCAAAFASRRLCQRDLASVQIVNFH
jgi:hypothetical protein